MTITELIKELERLREEYGNLSVYNVVEGGEKEPQVDVTETGQVIRNKFQIINLPPFKRAILH